ncbi:MAG: hypothetical protein WKG01_07525 [Kofleriaceae bacterium]
MPERTSLLLVLSGPCGTGKTSLSLAWQHREPDLIYSRSVTTRTPRAGAAPEPQYDFIPREEFMRRVEAGDFAQWIHPSYDEYYGTARAPIDQAIAEGRDMVFDYCPEGYLNLKRFYPAHVVGIFIMAPDIETMQRRLVGRNSETTEELKLRYQMALQDFNFVDQHEYHVVNDDFETALTQLRTIRVAERLRLARQRQVIAHYQHVARPSLLRYYEPAKLDTSES